jgi:hypothetical protein
LFKDKQWDAQSRIWSLDVVSKVRIGECARYSGHLGPAVTPY